MCTCKEEPGKEDKVPEQRPWELYNEAISYTYTVYMMLADHEVLRPISYICVQVMDADLASYLVPLPLPL